jgi:hypothetical protein
VEGAVYGFAEKEFVGEGPECVPVRLHDSVRSVGPADTEAVWGFQKCKRWLRGEEGLSIFFISSRRFFHCANVVTFWPLFMVRTSGISRRFGSWSTPGIVGIEVWIGGTGISAGSGRPICPLSVAAKVRRIAKGLTVSDFTAIGLV